MVNLGKETKDDFVNRVRNNYYNVYERLGGGSGLKRGCGHHAVVPVHW